LPKSNQKVSNQFEISSIVGNRPMGQGYNEITFLDHILPILHGALVVHVRSLRL
jgi:hypothetical protein